VAVAEYRTVCRIEELSAGEGRRFDWDGKRLAVFFTGAEYYAIDDTCLHAGGPLHEGGLQGTTVVCPWHHWEFDLKDGSCALNPHHKLDVYMVREREGEVQVLL
jgi:nitrite reductase/ring-hydroxylating ferredoxin subunit